MEPTPVRSAAIEPHEVGEGCMDCPHEDYCAGMGKCEIGAKKIAAQSLSDQPEVPAPDTELAGARAEARRAWEIVRKEMERANAAEREVRRLLDRLEALNAAS